MTLVFFRHVSQPILVNEMCKFVQFKCSNLQNFFQLSTMSSSDSETTASDLTSAKSDVGSPVIQDLDINMEADATTGSDDAGGNSTRMTDSSIASASMAPTEMTDSSIATVSTAASMADRAKMKKKQQMGCQEKKSAASRWDAPEDAQEEKSPTSLTRNNGTNHASTHDTKNLTTWSALSVKAATADYWQALTDTKVSWLTDTIIWYQKRRQDRAEKKIWGLATPELLARPSIHDRHWSSPGTRKHLVATPPILAIWQLLLL